MKKRKDLGRGYTGGVWVKGGEGSEDCKAWVRNREANRQKKMWLVLAHCRFLFVLQLILDISLVLSLIFLSVL